MKKQDTKKRTIIELEENSPERQWIEHQDNVTRSIIMAIDTMIELTGTDNDIVRYAPKLFASKILQSSTNEPETNLVSHAKTEHVLEDSDKEGPDKFPNLDSEKSETNSDIKESEKRLKEEKTKPENTPMFQDAGINVTGNF